MTQYICGALFVTPAAHPFPHHLPPCPDHSAGPPDLEPASASDDPPSEQLPALMDDSSDPLEDLPGLASEDGHRMEDDQLHAAHGAPHAGAHAAHAGEADGAPPQRQRPANPFAPLDALGDEEVWDERDGGGDEGAVPGEEWEGSEEEDDEEGCSCELCRVMRGMDDSGSESDGWTTEDHDEEEDDEEEDEEGGESGGCAAVEGGWLRESAARAPEDAECWVCFRSADEGGEGRLVAPCVTCSGSMEWMHAGCFAEWLRRSWSGKCPNCRQGYSSEVLVSGRVGVGLGWASV
jgi:hypothetical protein